MSKKRAAYRQQRAAAKASGNTLVYIVETGFQDETFRSYGYAPRGQYVREPDRSANTHDDFDSGAAEQSVDCPEAIIGES